MSIVSGFMNRVKRVHYGLNTRKDFLLSYIDRIILSLTGKKTYLYFNAHKQRISTADGRMYQIRDVKLPVLDENNERILFGGIYEETFWSYVGCNDRYDEEIYDKYNKFFGGLYGLVNDSVNVTVEPGDVVIDAGAWMGDFAAYASVKGASAVYAFEPTEQTFEILQKTAKLNKNIIPVRKGLSNENTNATLCIDISGNSGGNTFGDTLRIKGNDSPESLETVETYICFLPHDNQNNNNSVCPFTHGMKAYLPDETDIIQYNRGLNGATSHAHRLCPLCPVNHVSVL